MHTNTIKGNLDTEVTIHGVTKPLREHAAENTILIQHVGDREVEFSVPASGGAI